MRFKHYINCYRPSKGKLFSAKPLWRIYIVCCLLRNWLCKWLLIGQAILKIEKYAEQNTPWSRMRDQGVFFQNTPGKIRSAMKKYARMQPAFARMQVAFARMQPACSLHAACMQAACRLHASVVWTGHKTLKPVLLPIQIICTSHVLNSLLPVRVIDANLAFVIVILIG